MVAGVAGKPIKGFHLNFAHRLQLLLRNPIRPIVRFFAYFHYNTHYVDGSAGTLHIGKRVGLSNTICNLSSGSIHIGDYCIFGYNVMLLTGRHRFVNGMRASFLQQSDPNPTVGWGGGDEVPSSGYDIIIGEGTWLASGVVVAGGCTIGKHCVIAANSFVTSNIPDYAIAFGVPTRVYSDTRNLSDKSELTKTE